MPISNVPESVLQKQNIFQNITPQMKVKKEKHLSIQTYNILHFRKNHQKWNIHEILYSHLPSNNTHCFCIHYELLIMCKFEKHTTAII